MVNARISLAMAIWRACWRMYPEIYLRCGSLPEKAWAELHPSQRELFLHYADAAVEFMAVEVPHPQPAAPEPPQA